ncbi:BatA domain-containing protein [Pedobacter metabolipauper]|uniref:Putative membrane protein (TIGR02226 family) n=1 Tax=Pedobacter metabolipauper TaxID=425513 RepID=A0A4R6SVV8_9SPHI|nr:BatA and WFA domain-containing protein [Pedobacter metabolipauper]TDQ08501.1 putative membrane protein (TIGR02226 family) [Pedobacter metabolipauper]
MNFLYPGFLFALLAIAIPIVIHLFNFRKFKKIYFSNVQFLKEAKEQNSSREKLKHLLILMCRILAVAFLVFAFARPFIKSSSTNSPADRSVISIYIDNSYSMETVNKEGSLLDEAKRKAREIVKTYNLNDQFQLLTNDFEGKHQRLVNQDEFIQLLDEIKISPAGRSLAQIINRQQAEYAANTNHIAYLLSDFQKGFAGTEPLRSNPGVSVNFIKLNANNLPNIAVDSVWSLSPVHQPGQAEQIVVRLKNYGEEDAAEIPVKLTIDQQQKAIGNVAVKAGASVLDTLSFSGLKAGWQKGKVGIKDFPLTFDDELNFSFRVNKELKVLSINGDASEKFIRSLFSSDPYFKLTETPESNIRYSTFSEYSLIVLNGLKNPSSGLAQQLKGYVQNGGSVVVFPDLDAGAAVYTPFLTAMALPPVQQLVTGAPISSTIDLKNPVFKDVFDQVPRNMDLPVVNRYFSYGDQNSSLKESILQLPLGRSLFAKYNLGAGQVYLSAASLTIADGNLPRHPVFVPLMYKVAFASVREQPLFYTIGLNNLLESPKIDLLANQSLKLVTDQFEVIPEVRQTPGKTLLYIADQVKKAGFYELRKADSTLAVMAFNDNRTESDMHYASEPELTSLFGKQKVSVYNSKRDALSLNIQAKNSSTELWKLCLILVLVFLVLEILLIRFFNNPKNIQTA